MGSLMRGARLGTWIKDAGEDITPIQRSNRGAPCAPKFRRFMRELQIITWEEYVKTESQKISGLTD